jgi:hypothetical protein
MTTMTRQTVVRVTADHIEQGKASDCVACPVALAVTEAIPGLAAVAVDQMEVTAWIAWETWRAATPGIARKFIKRFDDCEAVKPVEFTLAWELVEPTEGPS